MAAGKITCFTRVLPSGRFPADRSGGADGSWGDGLGAIRQILASALGVLALCLVALAGRAEALTPIPVQGDQDRLEITTLGEAYEGRGDSLQVETAPAPMASRAA